MYQQVIMPSIIAARDSASVAKVHYRLQDPSVVVVQHLLDGGVLPRWTWAGVPGRGRSRLYPKTCRL